jgi:diacylglycerol kinase (ATP)
LAVEAVPTEGPATAASIARRCIQRGADLILAAGGDGTINEVANGMVHSNVPLGILPAGTANVLANELALGNTMERAAKSMDECVPERIALGLLSTPTAEPRHFLLMAGAGLDAEIVNDINPGLKDVLGKLDDQFELVLFEGGSSFTFLKYMLGVVVHRHQSMRGVTILRTRKASFSGSMDRKIHLQVDGEHAGLAPGSVEIVPNALTLLVPPQFRSRRPASVDDTAWTTSPTR